MKQKVISIVKFDVKIPLENYEDKGTLAADYAARDVVTPVKIAEERILSLLKIQRLPLNIDISAFLKKREPQQTIFTIEVTGGDENFLTLLFDSLYA
jgi:hypothetical protein